jgi:hypothetical protein
MKTRVHLVLVVLCLARGTVGAEAEVDQPAKEAQAAPQPAGAKAVDRSEERRGRERV